MSTRAYLDWNATAPLRGEARAAMLAAMDAVGNPSSVHGEGRAARRIVEAARAEVAALVGASARNVIFTSGGTEANVLALSPRHVLGTNRNARGTDRHKLGTDRSRHGTLLVSAVEHRSVSAGGRFPAEFVRELPVDQHGILEIPALISAVSALQDQNAGFLVSVMLANNETGVIQPIESVSEIVHRAGGLLHVDAVQAAGKIPCDINELGADLLSLSAHKLGGPKGAGALVTAHADLNLDPVLTGGGQERAARAGTENVVGIAGFGAAAAASAAELRHAARALGGVARQRNALEAELRRISPATVIFGVSETGDTPPRLPNTTLFAVPGASAETSLIALDLDGIAVSSGSACSSGKVSASHVLAAMGVPAELAACALRVSIGPATTPAEIDLFLNAWTKRIAGLSNSKRGLAA